MLQSMTPSACLDHYHGKEHAFIMERHNAFGHLCLLDVIVYDIPYKIFYHGIFVHM